MKKINMTVAAVVLAVVILAPALAGARGGDAHSEVKAFLSAYAKAVVGNDLAALKGLYSTDMTPVSVSPSGQGPDVGLAAIIKPWAEEFKKGYPYIPQYLWIKAGGAGRVLWFATAMQLSNRKNPGETPVTVLWSGVLYREWGKLRLVQEHTSTMAAPAAR